MSAVNQRGKYQPYPDYKDSGVEWLGKIPSHWSRIPLKYIINMKSGEAITTNDIDERGEYPVYGGNGFRGYTSDYTHSGTYVLIGRQGALCGNINYANGKFWASEHALVVKPKKITNTIWLGELLRAMNLNQYSITAAQPGLSAEVLLNLMVPEPSGLECDTIAAFLDYETARIDQLIAKQQQLIELLKEKRQAVISHAVTKGLNPNAPMKDSGVEWLGQVPEHWVVTRAKIVSEIFVPQRNKPELNDSGDGVHWATMEDMKNDEINETKKFVSKSAFDEAGSKVLKKGAVVASCVGNFGVATVLNIDVVINQQLQAYIPKAIMATYLRDLIVCSKVYFDLVGTAATLVYVNQEGFGNLPILLPPIAEQEEIEQKIDRSKAKFDRAIEKGRILVELLQERRTALISAAVTGKIDLRGWQPPKNEVAA